jgi:hypothetical protein
LITESQIKSALRAAPTCGKKSIELKDDGSRGEGRLALVVRATETRIVAEWYAVYYRAGKRVRTKIGSYPTFGIAESRKMFREAYVPKISAGQNPAGLRTRHPGRRTCSGPISRTWRRPPSLTQSLRFAANHGSSV